MAVGSSEVFQDVDHVFRKLAGIVDYILPVLKLLDPIVVFFRDAFNNRFWNQAAIVIDRHEVCIVYHELVVIGLSAGCEIVEDCISDGAFVYNAVA